MMAFSQACSMLESHGKADLRARFEGVEERIRAACQRAGRSRESVLVIAVAKKQPIEALKFYIEWCTENHTPCYLAENYVQELIEHRALLPASQSIHFIGRVQRNKVNLLVQHGVLIQSVDRMELLDALHRAADTAGRIVELYLQINISNDQAKAGFRPDEISIVRERLVASPSLVLRGLMAITKLYDNVEDVRPDFRQMRELRDGIDATLDLSIGMSQDFGIAIEEGATLVRIGSALFGERQ